jgi:hypothetical protein
MKIRFGVLRTLVAAVLLFAVSGFAPNVAQSVSGPMAVEGIPLEGVWKFRTDPGDVGLQKKWQSPGFDASAWKDIKVPGTWESQGFTEVNPTWKQADDLNQPYTGYAWYRKSVVIPSTMKGKNLRLRLGRIDDLDGTYVNGKLIGWHLDRVEATSSVARSYPIPESIVRWDEPNVIAVHVLDLRGVGGILDGPVVIQAEERASGGPGGSGSVTAKRDKVNVGGGVMVQAGETTNDAVAIGGAVQVYGHVNGDAVAVMGDVRVFPGGRVDGDAVSVGGRVSNEGGEIGGQTTSVGMGGLPFPWFHGIGGMGPNILFLGWSFILSLVLSLVYVAIVALFPTRIETIARVSLEKAGWSAIYGIVAWLLIIPVALVLLITCIGIPLIFVEILLAMVAFLVAKAAIALAVGWKLGEAVNKPIASSVLAVFIGAIAIALLHLVPCLGALVVFALTMLGFGAVLITGFGADPEWIWNRKRGGQSPGTSDQSPVISDQ